MNTKITEIREKSFDGFSDCRKFFVLITSVVTYVFILVIFLFSVPFKKRTKFSIPF